MSRVRTLAVALALSIVLTGLPTPVRTLAATAEAPERSLPARLTTLYFAETSHNVSGSFLRFWWEYGQLPVLGFPLSEEQSEGGRIVQYFERARLEFYPEHIGTQYQVQPSHLGRRLAPASAQAALQRVGPIGESPDRDYFEATGHTLSFAFKRFWERQGGLLVFGYPISEELEEQGRIVQYFERARFEYQPNLPGLPDEVQISHLGRQALAQLPVSPAAAPMLAGTTTWTPQLAGELAEQARVERQQRWLTATATPVAPFQASITVPSIELRRAPTTGSTLMWYAFERHIVHVIGVASGEPIGGDERWYQLGNGTYIPASTVAAFTPPAPPRVWAGHWIDVNLSTFHATAYNGSAPIYSALITAGRDNRTPVGVFSIIRRVRSETMNSATVGFPRGHPEYYYLPNVEYVQYITGRGHALHGNYWVHPARFGRFSSNGCVGLLNGDAAFFWSFSGNGTIVSIHY